MPSQEDLARALVDVDPCHFPRLLPDRVDSPTTETHSSWLRLPETRELGGDDLYTFAFALLLKAYIRSDSISCGLLTSSQSSTPGLPIAHLLRADFDLSTPLFDNSQKLVCIPLTRADDFREYEDQAGFKYFNATIDLTHLDLHEKPFENPFRSEIVLCVDSDTAYTGQVKATLHYRTDLLDRWCAQNVLATFESILSTISSNIDDLLSSVSLISSRDLQRIYSWNTNLPTPARQTLNEHFEKVFQSNVNKEAVYTSDGCFTYSELDDLSSVLAVRLTQLGLKRNMIVPICMNKSRWATCAMTAVWKSGGAVTTMDPAYPDERLFAIVEEVRARIIISDSTHAPRFKKVGVHVIADLEDLPQVLKLDGLPIPRVDAWRMADVRPDDLAFVAFTSGSTGRPKGVMHTHNRLTSEHKSYSWNAEYNNGARILQFGSYAFIAGVGDNFRSLLHGATLCVPSETERTSGLVKFINRSRSTRSYMTPSLVRTIDPKDVPSLKHLCVGGEPLGHDLEETWAAHVHFIQLYGASEGGFMIKDRSNPHYKTHGLFPIGGLSWLVDPQDVNKLVPIGAVGEIVFESHELATGYLNDAEKTAQTFIKPPVWAQERAAATGCGYLRMGDLGRYEIDGSLSIYGRADAQVKIHGQRVELGDIESNLRGMLPPKSEAIVDLVRPFDAPDRPVLTAFCRLELENVRRQEYYSDLDSETVISLARKHLEETLPRHMIPRAFLVMKTLPQNYKTDRRKLRSDASKLGYKALLASSLPVSDKPLQPPANDKERMLAELWAGILDQEVTGIGRHSDFLALGGDSLAAIRLVAASRSKNLGLTTQDILRCPILKNMAELAIVGNTDVGNAVITDDAKHDLSWHHNTITLRATDFQEWAASVGAINGGWIDHLVYDFQGRLDLQQLEWSCKGLVEAHSILRTVFELIGDRIHMRVHHAQDVPFRIHHATIDEMETQSNRIYAIDRISPLGSPILRFDLIKASPTRHRLIMRLSHAQYDGFCADTFGQHLRYLYLSQPIPRTLPFHEYARKIQDPRLIHDAEIYWRNHLKGSRMPRLVRRGRCGPPFDKNLDGEIRRLIVEPNLRRYGLSTAVLVKAAWALTLSSVSQSADVVFGDFIAGRQVHIPDIETVVGPCVNFMPVRVRLSPNLTCIELLKAVQADLVSAIPHESLGFKHIIQKCTDWGQEERFSSIVNFVNVGSASFGSETWVDDGEDKLEVDSIYEEQQHDKTDLWLLCLPGHLESKPTEDNGGRKNLELKFRYNTSLYESRVIHRIADLFCASIESLSTTLHGTVVIPQVSDEERSCLVPTSD
ncbi:hypothetical protein RU639_002249 [Aspergillus parasiticus]